MNKQIILSLYNTNRILSHLVKYHSAKDNFTLEQIYILVFLDQKKFANMKDVANFLGVSPASTTAIVERMIKTGWLEREIDQKDRRVINICISKGKKINIDKFLNEKFALITESLNRISDKDKQCMDKALDTLCENLTSIAYSHQNNHKK